MTTEDNYFESFLDATELHTEKTKNEAVPNWVNHKNSSAATYAAIISLKGIKNAYIKKHKLKSQYVKKSNYLIQKSEVARIVNKSAQPLFNSNSYSKELSNFFDNANQELEHAKNKRINAPGRGVANMRKEDLVIEHKTLLNTHNKSQLQMLDSLYAELISNIPLDIKYKLKLK